MWRKTNNIETVSLSIYSIKAFCLTSIYQNFDSKIQMIKNHSLQANFLMKKNVGGVKADPEPAL